MTIQKVLILTGLCVVVFCFSIVTFYKRDMRLVYKDGFRVGRVVGRDDILFNLKRKDCFQQSLDGIVQDQDKPLVEQLEKFVPKETAVGGTQGKKK